jgi:hypothetical protein
LPAVVLNPRGVKKARHGNEVGRPDAVSWTSTEWPGSEAQSVRLLDGDGTLLALAQPRGGGLLHPGVVLV